MTDNPLAAIAEGVKLVPWLQNATSHEGITTVKMASDEVKIIIAALTAAGEMAEKRPGWQPIANLTKEHLPALIKGGTYDWSDSWNNSFIPYTGVSIAHYMPDKWHDGAMKGDQCEGHDNYFWHKPEWFFPLATLDAAPASPVGEDVVTDDPFPIFSDRLRVRREECDEAEVNIDDSDILALAMDVLSGVGWKAPPASPTHLDDGELVERVAKAIYAVKGYCYTDDDRMFQAYPWDDHDEIIKEGFRTEARAALAAIKEGE